MFIGLISQGNASREYYGYVDKVFTCLFRHLSTKYLLPVPPDFLINSAVPEDRQKGLYVTPSVGLSQDNVYIFKTVKIDNWNIRCVFNTVAMTTKNSIGKIIEDRVYNKRIFSNLLTK